MIWQIILYALLAGLLGSVLGGLVVVLLRKPSKNLIGLAFAFASAVLVTLAFVDFLPHAIGGCHCGAGIWLTLVGVVIGLGGVFILKLFDKHGHEHVHGVFPHNEDCSHGAVSSPEKRRLITVAIIVSVAIVLHDFPKGLAIGASGSIWIAVAIGLSCLPEGMAMAMPLKAGGVRNWKILLVCALAGLSTVIGAIIGYYVGGINATLSGMMFAIAAGSIIGVVFMEMLPLSYQYTKNKMFHGLAIAFGVILVIVLNYFLHGLTY